MKLISFRYKTDSSVGWMSQCDPLLWKSWYLIDNCFGDLRLDVFLFFSSDGQLTILDSDGVNQRIASLLNAD